MCARFLQKFAIDNFDLQTCATAASGSKNFILKPRISNEVVPDDWELDEEEEEDTCRPVDPCNDKQLWEDE